MKQRTVNYENYPWTTPLLENFIWLGIYLLGSIIFSMFTAWPALTYLGYSLVCIYLLIPRFVCTHCSYYGRTCHSGQGKLAAFLFSGRDTARFKSYFKYMSLAAPVFLAPLIAAFVLFFIKFSWELVVLTIAFGTLALWCSRVVTKRLGCPYCSQKSVCPAGRNLKT